MSDVMHFTLHALHFIGIGLLIVAGIAIMYTFLFILFDPLIQDIARKDREYEQLVANRDWEFQNRRAIADAYIAEAQARLDRKESE